MPSSLKQFGRAFELVVEDGNGNVIIDVASKTWLSEQLEIEFEMEGQAQAELWYCNVSIYNLNGPTTQAVIKNGFTVKLYAGYQSQPYGLIYQGSVLQPMWERVDGIDYKLTLRCISGLQRLVGNFVSQSYAKGLSQRDLVARIAAASTFPFQVNANDVPTNQVSSRGEVVFGKPGKYLHEVASFNAINAWFDGQLFNFKALNQEPLSQRPTTTYTPATGLIGTPQATQDGVTIRVFLDPRIKVGDVFQLTPSTSIKQAPLAPGTFPTILDQSGRYVVIGIKHVGNSRANTWDTELLGLSPAFYEKFVESSTTAQGN